ncbi:MAG TPA: NUDIX domain-containing protein [Candidatus Nanoarchaeia archaeon]|nr:NUDIX domain-containing protein [Candidatus Woesearchaeota archaeon]HLC86963.1 NUDIX domain-containing protein [Candidatus Nanoarchaeia archaeon]
MATPKLSTSRKGKPMHSSVGAIIKKDDKYLLIDRVHEPFGFASLAGHIDEEETEIEAVKREVEEESGLKILSYKQVLEEEVHENKCHHGINIHYWYVFEADAFGEIKENHRETKSIGWYSKEQIKKLKLEPVWHHFFKKLKIV